MARLFENVKFHHHGDAKPEGELYSEVTGSVLPLRHCCKQINIHENIEKNIENTEKYKNRFTG